MLSASTGVRDDSRAKCLCCSNSITEFHAVDLDVDAVFEVQECKPCVPSASTSQPLKART